MFFEIDAHSLASAGGLGSIQPGNGRSNARHSIMPMSKPIAVNTHTSNQSNFSFGADLLAMWCNALRVDGF
jgi:hypothetical protein